MKAFAIVVALQPLLLPRGCTGAAVAADPGQLTHAVSINGADVQIPYSCRSVPNDVAAQFCRERGIVDASQHCPERISTIVSTAIARRCPWTLEHWSDRSVADYMRSLQWKMLDNSTYFGVKTWKFPFDIWVYRELLVESRPDVLVEIGNRFGGSALWFAHLFDVLGRGRVIAVDIDHSEVHPLARRHPRITWIEGDGVAAAARVAPLIAAGESVFVVEDASHTYAHTLELMRLYGALVTPGQYMVIEDTVLHNGVENPYFLDAGAFASVATYVGLGTAPCEWEMDRGAERYAITWNPTGFLRRKATSEACGGPPGPALGGGGGGGGGGDGGGGGGARGAAKASRDVGAAGDVTFTVGGGGGGGGGGSDGGGDGVCDDSIRAERARSAQLLAELEQARRYTDELRAQLLAKDRQLAAVRHAVGASTTEGE